MCSISEKVTNKLCKDLFNHRVLKTMPGIFKGIQVRIIDFIFFHRKRRKSYMPCKGIKNNVTYTAQLYFKRFVYISIILQIK